MCIFSNKNGTPEANLLFRLTILKVMVVFSENRLFLGNGNVCHINRDLIICSLISPLYSEVVFIRRPPVTSCEYHQLVVDHFNSYLWSQIDFLLKFMVTST